MAEMVCSALAQETVSRGISYVLGKREEKASQGHLVERLEMAVSEMELALERSAKMRITDVALLDRSKKIKRAYVEAVELLDRHKQLAGVSAGQELVARGVKRKQWVICADKKMSRCFADLSTDDVLWFEWYADRAGRFLREVESGCSLHHYTFCNPMVRHLLEGKTLRYHLEQGNLRQGFYIWPTYSEERSVEAVLRYHYEDSTMSEKSFILGLLLRLSESTDIVGVAIKGLQLLATGFKLVAECAIGELTSLHNLKDIAHLYGPPFVGIQEQHMKLTQMVRLDPTCCKGSRHGLCASNSNITSELADIYPEEVLCFWFQCYISAPESNTHRSSDAKGERSKRRGWRPPLVLTAIFGPHFASEVPDSCASETIGNAKEKRHASIEQVVETLKSDVTNCFSRQPQLMKYEIDWNWKHGAAGFTVEKEPSTERAGGAPKTKRSYNTRGSTRRSSRR